MAQISGTAHIQLSVSDMNRSVPFYTVLLKSMGMTPVLEGKSFYYCIGGMTGGLMRKFSDLLLCTVLASISVPAFSMDASEQVKVTPLLKTQESWDGKAIVYPTGQAEVTMVLVEIAPGGETGWHLHPVPSFGMVLEGELKVELKSGETLFLKAGDAAAETVNVLHNGHNIGEAPVKLLVFYAGDTKEKLTISESAAK
jgi:quercetin dioxygenase-like cupin family protein